MFDYIYSLGVSELLFCDFVDGQYRHRFILCVYSYSVYERIIAGKFRTRVVFESIKYAWICCQ